MAPAANPEIPARLGAPPSPLQSAPQSAASEASAGGHQVSGSELLAWRRSQLQRGGQAVDLDWLLDLGGGLAWRDLQALRLHPERLVALQRPLAALATLWRRHLDQQAPLQYLLGRCPWRDLEVRVAPGVLIPRQETELLVELALAAFPTPPRLWADLGTGSGCLALALALAWPGRQGLAVDCSPEALVQAQDNLQRADVADRVTLVQGDWWQGLEPWWGQLELVLSNPPYIPTATVEGLDPLVLHHEPRLALDGGGDGLAAVRAILALAPQALAPGGLLLLEHHHDQSAAVLELMAKAGLHDLQAHHDLEGTRRFAAGRRPISFP